MFSVGVPVVLAAGTVKITSQILAAAMPMAESVPGMAAVIASPVPAIPSSITEPICASPVIRASRAAARSGWARSPITRSWLPRRRRV